MCHIGWVVVVVAFKANCLFVRPGPTGEVPSVGVFLRDPSPYFLDIWDLDSFKLIQSFSLLIRKLVLQ